MGKSNMQDLFLTMFFYTHLNYSKGNIHVLYGSTWRQRSQSMKFPKLPAIDNWIEFSTWIDHFTNVEAQQEVLVPVIF